VSNLKALECARGKRLDPATQQYVFGYEEALALARKPLARKYGESDVVYFEKQIDRFMDELLEDPARAIAKRFLADNSLDSEIRNSLANAPTETATPDTPERLLLEIKRKQGTLNRIAAKRFHKGHTQTVAVPDGNGSYFIDTVGTPGRWEVFLTTGDDDRAAAASVTRLLDALCDIFLGNTPPTSPLERGFTGEDDQVVIVEDVAAANGIAVEHLGSGRLRLYLASRLLELSRADLRALLRDAFATLEPAPGLSRHNHDWEPAANGTRLSKIPRPCGVGSCSSECHSGFVATRTPAATQEVAHNQRPPGVVMLDFSGTSGPYLVAHALEMKGIPAQVIKPGGKITLERPAIFCISLATQPLGFSEVGEHIKTLREFIDEHFPGSFIILGGPSAKHPKAAIALLPEINILLRGEGEEVLPEVVRIIGATRLTDGLNRKQIDELKQIDGLFLHTPGFIMLNNLNEVNAPADFDVPVMFHYGSFSLFGGGGPIASRTIITPTLPEAAPSDAVSAAWPWDGTNATLNSGSSRTTCWACWRWSSRGPEKRKTPSPLPCSPAALRPPRNRGMSGSRPTRTNSRKTNWRKSSASSTGTCRATCPQGDRPRRKHACLPTMTPGNWLVVSAYLSRTWRPKRTP